MVEVVYSGSNEIESFALGILYLTNLKSSVPDSVVDFKTHMSTDLITVTMHQFFHATEGYTLSTKLGKEVSVTPLMMYSLEDEDIKGSIQQDFDKQLEKYYDSEDMREPLPFYHIMRRDY